MEGYSEVVPKLALKYIRDKINVLFICRFCSVLFSKCVDSNSSEISML